MNENVSKKKIEWQRKTYPLKLKLSEEQKERIDVFLEEYQKVTNFIIEKCVNEIFPFYKKQKEPFITKKCSLCNKEKKMKYQWKTPQGKKTLNCGCLNGHYSLRKLFLPSGTHAITDISTKEFDMRFAGKLYDGFPKMIQGGSDLLKGSIYNHSMYDSCLQKAVETIKSYNALNDKIDSSIKQLLHRNTIIKKILSNELIETEFNNDKEFYSKFEAKKLKKFLKKNKEKLDKLEKRKAKKVEFKGNMARIYSNYYSWIKENENDFRLQLTLFEKPMEINFFGKKYQKKKAGAFSRQENQPEIELLKRKNDYFIQYIYRQTPNIPLPDETFTAIGIDLGILNHYTMACIKKEELNKPFNIRFFSGRAMRRKRRQYYKIRRIWQKKTKHKDKNGKGRSEKWMKNKMNHQNEKRFIKTEMHKISTELAQFIHDSVKKPVIILEDLKDIRDETKKMKKSHLETLKKKLKGTSRKWYLKERYLNKELNNWNFKDLYEFLKYKAEWLGIPVMTLSAVNSSIECNKCGHIDEKNYYDLHQLKFKCLNCGYECNADFNASVNLARRFFDFLGIVKLITNNIKKSSGKLQEKDLWKNISNKTNHKIYKTALDYLINSNKASIKNKKLFFSDYLK